MNPIQIIFLLGWTNILGLTLIFLSCRCIAGSPAKNLLKYKWFKIFYKFHCYYWWFFISSVLLHAILAFKTFGNPF